QMLKHLAPLECSVDKAIDFGHPHQPGRGRVRIDRIRGDKVLQSSLVYKEQPVPFARRMSWTVVYPAVLAGHSVKHEDSTSACGQGKPQKVRNKIGVEPHRRRLERGYDFNARAGIAIDIRSAFWLLGRYKVELNAGVLAHALHNGRDDGIIHRP